jgi:hypothetical protein
VLLDSVSSDLMARAIIETGGAHAIQGRAPPNGGGDQCLGAGPARLLSEGDTEDEALENIRDAIREYLLALDDQMRDAEVREVEVAV